MPGIIKFSMKNIQTRIANAITSTEKNNILMDLMAMSDWQLMATFGVPQTQPSEMFTLKDRIFTEVLVELSHHGWDFNTARFGVNHRNTMLIEMAGHGFAQSVDCLLALGADPNYNAKNSGNATALMSTRDTRIMNALIRSGADPMEMNEKGEMDFTRKLLSGQTACARAYLRYLDKFALKPMLENYRACLVNGAEPQNPLFPLCIMPAIPNNSSESAQNVFDQKLLDVMIANQYLPFSARALALFIAPNMTAWRYIRDKLENAGVASTSLLIAYLACMSKAQVFQQPADFRCVETYIQKPFIQFGMSKRIISAQVFVYMLFALNQLAAQDIVKWVVLLGKVVQKVTQWQQQFGGVAPHAFAVFGNPQRQHDTVTQALVTLQVLLSMRINIPDSYGEFNIPTGLLERRMQTAASDAADAGKLAK